MLDIKPIIRGYRNETGPVAKLRHFDDACARLFAYAARRVASGLLTPTLGFCYGGEPSEMRKQIGRAHVPVTNAHIVFRLPLEKKKSHHISTTIPTEHTCTQLHSQPTI